MSSSKGRRRITCPHNNEDLDRLDTPCYGDYADYDDDDDDFQPHSNLTEERESTESEEGNFVTYFIVFAFQSFNIIAFHYICTLLIVQLINLFIRNG